MSTRFNQAAIWMTLSCSLLLNGMGCHQVRTRGNHHDVERAPRYSSQERDESSYDEPVVPRSSTTKRPFDRDSNDSNRRSRSFFEESTPPRAIESEGVPLVPPAPMQPSASRRRSWMDEEMPPERSKRPPAPPVEHFDQENDDENDHPRRPIAELPILEYDTSMQLGIHRSMPSSNVRLTSYCQ